MRSQSLCVAGLAVGCTAPIKDLLFRADPPLGFFSDSLSIMAGAMIPSMMLVLGSVLHKGPGSAKVPKRVILGILAVRQVIIPILGKIPMHSLAMFGRLSNAGVVHQAWSNTLPAVLF